MFEVKDDVIYITKGETGSLTLSVYNADGTKRKFVTGDRFNLQVRMDTSHPANDNDYILNLPVSPVNGSTECTINITKAISDQLTVGKFTCRIWFHGNNGDEAMIFPGELFAKSKIGEDGNWKNFWVLPWR